MGFFQNLCVTLIMASKRQQPTLHGFFQRKRGRDSEDEVPAGSEADNLPKSEEPPVTLETATASSTPIANEMGPFVSAGERPDDRQLYELLSNHWKPPSNYQFPYSTHSKGGKIEKRYLKQIHFQNFHWLVYSEKEQGLFCLYCPFFASNLDANSRTVHLDKFVKRPLKTFAKLLGKDGDLNCHSVAYYHLAAVEKARNFMRGFENASLQINNRIDTDRRRQVSTNRARISSIIRAVLFLGRQNVPLRGHRDSGRIDPLSRPSLEDSNNDGNFRQLLRHQVESGDSVLQEFLEKSASNAMYTSSVVQYDLICCIGRYLQQHILQRLRACGPYSVMFDETTDRSHTNIMSFLVRYVDKSGGSHTIREDFLDFLDT